MTELRRFLNVGTAYVDADAVYKAELAVAVGRRHLGLPPVRVQWVMPADLLPSWWSGKAHERPANWGGWVDLDHPDRIQLDASQPELALRSALHELRHCYQVLAGWSFDRDRWEADADQWATEALNLPI